MLGLLSTVIGGSFVMLVLWIYSKIDEKNDEKKAESAKIEAEEKRKEKLEQQIKQEQEEAQLAHMEGLEKYHKMDVEEVRRRNEAIPVVRQLGLIVEQSVYQEKKHDWAVLGGIADGLAGPIAGIATAANAIQDNARIEAENAARREWGAQQKAFYLDLASRAEQENAPALSMTELQKKYKAILDWSPCTLLALINTHVKTEIDELTGAVTVSVTWYQSDKSICIDGSLRAKIYTDDDKCVGCAYLVFPKIGTVRFSGRLRGICARPNKSATSYKVKLEPANLWELASKENIVSRKTDDLTKEEHRKIVADLEADFKAEME